jgi:Uma2 family endonuclease
MNIGFELRSRLDSRCRVVAEAGIVPPHHPDTFYIADLAVACRETATSSSLVEEPILIIEVLSPSTEVRDRGSKLPEYLRIPSLEGVLLASSTEQRLQVWHRKKDHWIVHDIIGKADMTLPRLSSPIPLSSIYLNVSMRL